MTPEFHLPFIDVVSTGVVVGVPPSIGCAM
jgi:hypothetical protein